MTARRSGRAHRPPTISRKAVSVPLPVSVVVDPRFFGPLLLLGAAILSTWMASRGLPFQDEGSTLTNAAKILDGGVFYRDIDAYPFPGAPYLLAAAMSVFGEHLSVARSLAGVLYCVWVGALYLAALPLAGRSRAALFGLTLLAVKFVSWPAFSSYMYSDVSFTFGCLALLLLASPRARSVPVAMALAGVFVAGALASKQNLGIYLAGAGLGVLVVDRFGLFGFGQRCRRPWREPLMFLVGILAPLVCAASYFASHGLLWKLLFSGLVRPFTGYLPSGGVPFTPMLAWWRLGEWNDNEASSYFLLDYFQLLVKGLLPATERYEALYWLIGELIARSIYTAVLIAGLGVVLVGLLALRRRRIDERGRRLLMVGALSGAIVLSAFPRADIFHIISVFPVVLLILFSLGRRDRGERPSILLTGGVVVALLLSGLLAQAKRSTLTHRVKMSRANVVVTPEEGWIEVVVDAIRKEIRAGEPFFVYGHEAQFYFLSDRYFDWRFPQLYPGQIGDGGGADVVALLEEEPPAMVLQGILEWVGVTPIPSFAPAIETYIQDHYQADEVFFLRYPPASGSEGPPGYVAQVLFPRRR